MKSATGSRSGRRRQEGHAFFHLCAVTQIWSVLNECWCARAICICSAPVCPGEGAATPWTMVWPNTTGKRFYPDGQNYAYGCRRPTSSYTDSLVLAVGLHLSTPTAAVDLDADTLTAAVGIPVGPATPPVTSG
nr:uncharacterized protein LOC120969906 [Aegilops tauschii subsp. strangulata]